MQRIIFDLENEDVASAIKRCDNLDELLTEIEDGKHTLIIGDVVQVI